MTCRICPRTLDLLDAMGEAIRALPVAGRTQLRHDLCERSAQGILELYATAPRQARDAHPPDLTSSLDNYGTPDQRLLRMSSATDFIQ